MSGTPSVPRAGRRAAIRDRLLGVVEAALEQGESYEQISVGRLAAQAGLPRTRFYLFFEDKDDLLLAWFATVTAELDAHLESWWAMRAGISQEALRGALAPVVAARRGHRTLLRAVDDAASLDARTQAAVDAVTERRIAGLTAHIRGGRRDGWITTAADPAGLAGWLCWMEERGVQQLLGGAEDACVQRVADAYAAIVWKTLYAD